MVLIEQQATDREFATRSARYLADRGCDPDEIRRALRDELDLDDGTARGIVDQL